MGAVSSRPGLDHQRRARLAALDLDGGAHHLLFVLRPSRARGLNIVMGAGFSEWGWRVFSAEMALIWLPAGLVALLARGLSRR